MILQYQKISNIGFVELIKIILFKQNTHLFDQMFWSQFAYYIRN